MPFHGGIAARKGVRESDVDPGELARGASVEMEHTDNPRQARRIALDHLAERPDYYTRLEEVESEGGIRGRDPWVFMAGALVGWGLSYFLSGRKV